LLAGRILLLADDSLTIQKVVDLTFADEGVRVSCVGNGREAIEKLNQIVPDVVLADVFMPEVNGYQVCEYVKQNEKLKHIPVVLLVGSFEPFDEAEARRVGADDTLTKPFQSIRKLIDKVGGLMGKQPPQEEVATAELPKVDAEEPEQLSTEEIEITTADTRPLHVELEGKVSSAATPRVAPDKPTEKQHMEPLMSPSENGSAVATEATDELLDLGDLSVEDVIGEEFVLDLDFSAEDELAPVAATNNARVFVEPKMTEAREFSAARSDEPAEEVGYATIAEQFAETQEILPGQFSDEAEEQEAVSYSDQEPEPVGDRNTSELIRVTDDTEQFTSVPPAPMHSSTPSEMPSGQLSQEMIDAIARRVVEYMSDKVIEEIAWEVVPQLAELMIKRQLEEKKP
jgi:CheY-like chemotaxis protein